LVVLPLLGLTEKTLEVPKTISTPVLPGDHKKGSGPALPAGAAAAPENKG
jgi:hypothetical protein